MLRVENLIVEGKCFIPAKIDPKVISGLKYTITKFMYKKGYKPEDSVISIFQDQFLTINFLIISHSQETPIGLRIKKKLRLITEEKIRNEKYLNNLKTTRDDYPFKVSFYITAGKINNSKGFIIKIRSEPVILYKFRQIGLRPILDEFHYSDIINTNKQFIEEIMIAIGSKIIEKPKALAEQIKTPIIEKLEKIGLKEVSELLKKGRTKIERGDIEDGLTDLRSCLEKFAKQSMEKVGEKSNNNLKENLKRLKEKGIINQNVYNLINKILYEWLYRYLSDKPVHKREKINLTDARFLFSITEEIMNFLIEKILFRY